MSSLICVSIFSNLSLSFMPLTTPITGPSSSISPNTNRYSSMLSPVLSGSSSTWLQTSSFTRSFNDSKLFSFPLVCSRMGWSEATATASSGMLLAYSGVFLEHELRTSMVAVNIRKKDFFIGWVLKLNHWQPKDTMNNQYLRILQALSDQRVAKRVIACQRKYLAPKASTTSKVVAGRRFNPGTSSTKMSMGALSNW